MRAAHHFAQCHELLLVVHDHVLLHQRIQGQREREPFRETMFSTTVLMIFQEVFSQSLVTDFELSQPDVRKQTITRLWGFVTVSIGHSQGQGQRVNGTEDKIVSVFF